MRIAGLIAAAVAWGLLIFVIALRVHFPSDVALERIQVELQNRTDNAWALDASSLSLWGLSGVRFDDVTFYSLEEPKRRRRVRRRASGSDDVDNAEDIPDPIKATPFLQAERVRARVALLPFLGGTQKVVFNSRILSGDLRGTVAQSDEQRSIFLEGRSLDLSKLPIGGSSWSIDATGKMMLDVDLDLSNTNPRESTGEIHLSFEGLGIQSAQAMGMELTPVAFSEAVFDINLANGKAEFAQGVLDGDILDATFSGYITLSKKDLMRSRLRVNVRMELDSTLDSLAKFSPDLREARDEEGVYHLLCTGTLKRPSCSADRRAAGNLTSSSRRTPPPRPAKTNRPKPKMGPDFVEDQLDEEDVRPLDEEEAREARRKRRLERIRERRERLREERKLRELDGDDGTGDFDDEEFFEPQRPQPIPLPGRDFGPRIPRPDDMPMDDGFGPRDDFGPDDLPPEIPPFDDVGGSLPDDGMGEPY